MNQTHGTPSENIRDQADLGMTCQSPTIVFVLKAMPQSHGDLSRLCLCSRRFFSLASLPIPEIMVQWKMIRWKTEKTIVLEVLHFQWTMILGEFSPIGPSPDCISSKTLITYRGGKPHNTTSRFCKRCAKYCKVYLTVGGGVGAETVLTLESI